MPFWQYDQNNSFGSFDFDEEHGITAHVIIEAMSSEEADERLIGIGGYFDGCEDGIDCPCCGDRWYCAQDKDGDPVPMFYGQPVKDATSLFSAWMREGKEIAVHPLHGPVAWYGVKIKAQKKTADHTGDQA